MNTTPTRLTPGTPVLVTPRWLGGKTLVGEVTGVHIYPSGTCDYSVGCREESLLIWVHESLVSAVSAVEVAP